MKTTIKGIICDNSNNRKKIK